MFYPLDIKLLLLSLLLLLLLLLLLSSLSLLLLFHYNFYYYYFNTIIIIIIIIITNIQSIPFNLHFQLSLIAKLAWLSTTWDWGCFRLGNPDFDFKIRISDFTIKHEIRFWISTNRNPFSRQILLNNRNRNPEISQSKAPWMLCYR